MNDCCSPKGYRWIFSERSARAEAKRYRRKGLDATSRRIVEILKREGVQGRTVLEVGGGIGALEIELLKAGAARAVGIELTPTYEEVASGLLKDAGLEDRVQRQVMDFAEAGSLVDAADVVVMNRVICCYPDMPKLAGAAADHTRQVLVLSYPRDTLWIRIGLALGNLLLRLMRRQFQVFVHPSNKVLAISEQHGLKPIFKSNGVIWSVAALRRAA